MLRKEGERRLDEEGRKVGIFAREEGMKSVLLIGRVLSRKEEKLDCYKGRKEQSRNEIKK